MQISNKLPQFKDNKTLIIVTGKQAADIHLAYDGTLKTLKKIRVETPTYSDREGHFERQSKGKTLGSGSVYEKPEKKAMQNFRNELADFCDSLKEEVGIDQVIFLRPSPHKKELKEKLPKAILDAIVMELDGNVVGDHPDDILKRIQKHG